MNIMENSSNVFEEQQPFKSPPRRRRSTFFIRRDSIAPDTEPENICDTDAESNERHRQAVSSYSAQLLSEKDEWKKEVNKRRDTYHDLRQQYQLAAASSSRSRIPYSSLSAEDIEFVKGKPNLSKFIENQLRLHESVKETQALLKRVNELDNEVLSYCESKVNQITEYILENSTVDAMK